MIELKDLNIRGHLLTEEQKAHLIALAFKLTKLEDLFGSLFKITSGFRTKEDQIHIYNIRGIYDESKMHFFSQHLSGNAADIFDPRRNLEAFLATDKGLKALETIGLYQEAPDQELRVHLQQVAPRSGKRVFIG